jgi:uncharacterized membrane protein YebE (DUF533 family)
MVSAAQADGHVDDAERQRIEESVGRLDLDSEAFRLFQHELARPVDPAGLASEVDSPEAAVEVYLASLLAIDVDNYMERGYLEELTRQLDLSPELTHRLEAEARNGA